MDKSLLQGTLFTVLLLGIGIRLSHMGWILIIFGIPLLGIAIIHLAVQLSAINRTTQANLSLSRLLLFSNLFFFLGFVLQPDFADSPEPLYPSEALANLFGVLSIIFLGH